MAITALASTLPASLGLPSGTSAAAAVEYSVTRSFTTSFDGTEIVFNLYIPAGATAADPAPAILQGHGWGGQGQTPGYLSTTVERLLDEGYVVMTFDSRGFGHSGGAADWDNADLEVRDAMALVDVLASRPEVLQEAPGDPVLGMTNGSYAGHIQLALAAHDARVDAIAPEITWNSLDRALFPGGVVKQGWLTRLYGNGLRTAATGGMTAGGPAGIETGAYSVPIHNIFARTTTTGVADAASRQYYRDRSHAGWGQRAQVRVPTLLIQSPVDTLFDLNEGWANFQQVAATGAPVRMISFCGGHIVCPVGYDDGDARRYVDDAILAWFDHHLRGAVAPTGAPVEYTAQDGVWRSLPTLPTAAAPGPAVLRSAAGTGRIESVGVPSGDYGSVSQADVTAGSTAGRPDTLTVPVLTATQPTDIIGVGRADLRVWGVGDGTHLYLKLVHRETDHVLDLQEAAIRVDGLPIFAGNAKQLTVDLSGVAYQIPAGHHLDLQVATSSLGHTGYRTSAVVNVAASVVVPTIGR